MADDTFLWVILCIICSVASYLFGRYSQSKGFGFDFPSTQEGENEEESALGPRSDVSESAYLKKQLDIERQTQRRMEDQYQNEIKYLKDLLDKTRQKQAEKFKKHEETHDLLHEMTREMGPVVNVIEGTKLLSGQDLTDQIERELEMPL